MQGANRISDISGLAQLPTSQYQETMQMFGSPEKHRQTIEVLRATHEHPDVARVDTAELVSTKRGDRLVLKAQSIRNAKEQQAGDTAAAAESAAGDKV